MFIQRDVLLNIARLLDDQTLLDTLRVCKMWNAELMHEVADRKLRISTDHYSVIKSKSMHGNISTLFAYIRQNLRRLSVSERKHVQRLVITRLCIGKPNENKISLHITPLVERDCKTILGDEMSDWLLN